MSRNSSGNYSLPAGNPVVLDTTITPDWANGTLNDLVTAITDSLSRSGNGGMLAALKLIDGALSSPGLAFASEASSGLYRAGAGDLRLVILGAVIAKLTATGLSVTGNLLSTGVVTGTYGIFSSGLADDTSHGARGNGSLHTAATGSINGFMSAADKTKLDAATDVATVSTLMKRDAAGNVKVATPTDPAHAATKDYVDGLTASGASVDVSTQFSWGTGWSTAYGNLSVRTHGPILYFTCEATAGAGAAWANIGTLAAGYRPTFAYYYVSAVVYDSSTTTYFPARVYIPGTTGTLTLQWTDNGTSYAPPFAIGAGDRVNLQFSFPIG